MKAPEITKEELIERERTTWKDVVKRLDFLTEMAQAKTDRVMVKDAFNKLVTSLHKYRPIFVQRVQLEFAGTK